MQPTAAAAATVAHCSQCSPLQPTAAHCSPVQPLQPLQPSAATAAPLHENPESLLYWGVPFFLFYLWSYSEDTRVFNLKDVYIFGVASMLHLIEYILSAWGSENKKNQTKLIKTISHFAGSRWRSWTKHFDKHSSRSTPKPQQRMQTDWVILLSNTWITSWT